MGEIAESYTIHSPAQVRALADSLRFRVLDLLTQEPMTVSQLGAKLGFSRANMLYHVRELEQVGLVFLAEKREKGGMLEKYYSAIARTMFIAPDVFRSATANETVTTIQEWFSHVMQEGLSVAAHKAAHPTAPETLVFSRRQLWLTTEQFHELEARILELLDAYRAPQHTPDEQAWAVNLIGYTMLEDTVLPGVTGQEE